MAEGTRDALGRNNDVREDKRTAYTGTMGGPSGEGGLVALGPRLAELKRWVAWDAGISVHSAVCVVNGKATVATHNAPYADALGHPARPAGGRHPYRAGAQGRGRRVARQGRRGSADGPANARMYF